MKRYTLVTVLLVSSMSFVGCMAGGDWSGEPSELTTDGNFVNLSGKTKATGLKTSLAPKHGTLTSKSSQKLGQTLHVPRKNTLTPGIAIIGQWSGTYTAKLNGHKNNISVTFSKLKKLGFVAPKRPKKSFWQRFSLFRSAHACGPYGTKLEYDVSATWENLQLYVRPDSTGKISSTDRFQKQAMVELDWEFGVRFSGYFVKNNKTNQVELRGNVFRLYKEGRLFKTEMYGNVVMTRVQPSTPQ